MIQIYQQELAFQGFGQAVVAGNQKPLAQLFAGLQKLFQNGGPVGKGNASQG